MIVNRIDESENDGVEEEIIWKVAYEILQGTKILHKNKVIHRDIKSANIFFVGNVAKLGDMNVSKLTENGLCSTNIGTPYYTAPEIWKGLQYDSKCDIWSIGCVIY
jgi:NIMA (never in mitosis gene a)-related kinase